MSVLGIVRRQTTTIYPSLYISIKLYLHIDYHRILGIPAGIQIGGQPQQNIGLETVGYVERHLLAHGQLLTLGQIG